MRKIPGSGYCVRGVRCDADKVSKKRRELGHAKQEYIRMKNLQKYEMFGLNEGVMSPEHSKYLDRTAHYKSLIEKLGV